MEINEKTCWHSCEIVRMGEHCFMVQHNVSHASLNVWDLASAFRAARLLNLEYELSMLTKEFFHE